MKRILLLTLPVLLAACGALASPATAVPDYSATKLFHLTGEALTVTANQPKNDATLAAILATKHAMGTAMAQTFTAIPTLTLTATIPSESPVCAGQDLRALFTGTNGATQSIVFGVNLTNVRGSPCFLQLWPQAILVDPSGNPLDVTYNMVSLDAQAVDPNTLLGLPAGRTAGFSFQWGNWCMPPVLPGVSIRLTLAQDGDTITIPTGLTSGGVCNDSGSSSWVGVFPFSLP